MEPQIHYCLWRTRAQLAGLALAALALLFAVSLGVVFFTKIQEEKTDWVISDYATVAVAGVAGVAMLLLSLYEGVTDLRDALFPAKSRLAKSIRSQLSFPDEAPSIQELFAAVDRDIQEHGQWFDRVAVGKEWIFGDEVSLLSRVRVVAGRNEMHLHHSANGRTQSSRTIQLYILDDRRQMQMTGLRNPNELQPLLDCIRLRCPDAVFCSYDQYQNYCGKSEEEWQSLLKEYNARHSQREQKQKEDAYYAHAAPNFRQTDLDSPRAVAFQVSDLGLKDDSLPQRLPWELTVSERSGATRQFRSLSRRDVLLAAAWLSDGKYTAISLHGGAEYIYLQGGTAGDGRITVNLGTVEKGQLRVYETKCSYGQAKEYLLAWTDRRFTADLSKWNDITKRMEKQRKKQNVKRR